MPTNKNTIVRYKYLDDLLSDCHHYYSTCELWEKCNEKLTENGFSEVSLRWILKDIKFLEYSLFDAPIERFRKFCKKCVRYEDPSFSIFNEEMSDVERNLLWEVLNTLGQFDGLNNFKWLDNLKIGLGIKERSPINSFSNNPYLQNSHLLGSLFYNISMKLPFGCITIALLTIAQIMLLEYLKRI